jgi:hypothetical protein
MTISLRAARRRAIRRPAASRLMICPKADRLKIRGPTTGLVLAARTSLTRDPTIHLMAAVSRQMPAAHRRAMIRLRIIGTGVLGIRERTRRGTAAADPPARVPVGPHLALRAHAPPGPRRPMSAPQILAPREPTSLVRALRIPPGSRTYRL